MYLLCTFKNDANTHRLLNSMAVLPGPLPQVRTPRTFIAHCAVEPECARPRGPVLGRRKVRKPGRAEMSQSLACLERCCPGTGALRQLHGQGTAEAALEKAKTLAAEGWAWSLPLPKGGRGEGEGKTQYPHGGKILRCAQGRNLYAPSLGSFEPMLRLHGNAGSGRGSRRRRVVRIHPQQYCHGGRVRG